MLAVPTTQWIIAIGSLGSALIALALGFGLKDWVRRPRVRLVLRREADPGEISDRVVTQRLETEELAAFVRLRVDNRGRSTARNVGVRLLRMHRWDPARGEWTRSRPELDGRLLQPSNHQSSEPALLDVFPYTDRIVDLASVEPADGSDGSIWEHFLVDHHVREVNRPPREAGDWFGPTRVEDHAGSRRLTG